MKTTGKGNEATALTSAYFPESLPMVGEGCRRAARKSAWQEAGGSTSKRSRLRLIDEEVRSPTGPKVQPYLPELMECMLQPLRNPSSPRAKELAVSALGAIGEDREAGGGGVEFTQRACGRWLLLPFPLQICLSILQPQLPRPPCCPTSPPLWNICENFCWQDMKTFSLCRSRA